MPRGSEELTNARKAEIVNACAVLYETRSFKEITLKEIGEKTSFTRTSIYNYFQTKEEIFLALFQRELSLIHISEPTRQAEISYAVFCLKKKKKQNKKTTYTTLHNKEH